MRIRVHPLCPVMLLCALLLGEGARATALLLSVTLHELAHVAAARAFRLPVYELELMPCGGAARFGSVWGMRPGVLCLVAACGPACNLLLACLTAALGWWGLLGGEAVCRMVVCNLTLAAFNLLPALPLDGGRILCALLMRRLPPARAVRWGVRLGQGLGALLVTAGCAMAAFGRYNLTLILCGAYLLLSAPAENRRAAGAALESLMSRRAELERERALPVRMLAVSPDTLLAEAASRMVPGAAYRFLVALPEGARVVEEGEVLRALLREPGAAFSGLTGPGSAGAR